MFKKLKKALKYDKDKYKNILEDPNNRIWVFLSKLITYLIIVFAAVLAFESIWNNVEIYKKEIYIFEAFISIIFAVEYFYRFCRAKKKLNFLISPIRIIDLISFLPFFLNLAFGEYLLVLRLLRILRILKLIKDIPLTAWFVKSLKDYKEEYKAVFILFLITLFISSSYVYFLEKDIIWTNFTSIPMALWWGLITMSTVWYWDMIPVTNAWKIIAWFLVFVWPLILALASAITVMVFMDTAKKNEVEWHSRRWKKCSRCHEKNPKNANYCMKCGKDLHK